MQTHTLQTEIWLPCLLNDVFIFFADAGNIDRITPSWLRFEILTPLPVVMRPGALIDYQLRIHGIPIRWRSKITEWNPPFSFVDEQRRGPYRRWRHQHTIAERDGGTLAGDHVEYAVWGGALVNKLLVERDVQNIFRYRQQTLLSIFYPQS